MVFAACIVPAAPVNALPAFEAEMTSQFLFGETMEVLERKGDWWQVAGLADRYEGWVSAWQVTIVSREEAEQANLCLTRDLLTKIHWEDGIMWVPAGSQLPGFQNGSGRIASYTYSSENQSIRSGSIAVSSESIHRDAIAWLNVPYRWGGRSVLGTDCSGFTQVVFKLSGLQLKRDASHQAMEGEPVGFLAEARCGDLAFFEDREGRIVHVGILLNEREIIHAFGKVRIDGIDHAGIVQKERGLRTHSLRLIKRYF